MEDELLERVPPLWARRAADGPSGRRRRPPRRAGGRRRAPRRDRAGPAAATTRRPRPRPVAGAAAASGPARAGRRTGRPGGPASGGRDPARSVAGRRARAGATGRGPEADLRVGVGATAAVRRRGPGTEPGAAPRSGGGRHRRRDRADGPRSERATAVAEARRPVGPAPGRDRRAGRSTGAGPVPGRSAARRSRLAPCAAGSRPGRRCPAADRAGRSARSVGRPRAGASGLARRPAPGLARTALAGLAALAGVATAGRRAVVGRGRGRSAMTDLDRPSPALPVARVLDGDAERRQFVAQSVRRREVARRAGSDARSSSAELAGSSRRPVRHRAGSPSTRSMSRRALEGAARIGRRHRPRLDPPVEVADEVEHDGQPGRDVEVVVERLAESRPGRRRGAPAASGRPARPRRTPPSAATRRIESVEGRARGGQRLVGVVEAGAVVDRDEREPQRPRPRRPVARTSPTRAMLPVDLAIFAPPIWRWAQWSHVPTKVCPVAASLWAISSSWCGKMRSTPPVWMSNDGPRWAMLIAEHSMCQPGRPGPIAVSHDGSPGLGPFHSGEVADVVLAVLVGLDPLPDPQPLGVEAGQPPVGRPRRDPEEDRAVVGPVGVAALEQRRDELDDLVDVPGRARQDVGASSSAARRRPPGTSRDSARPARRCPRRSRPRRG